MKVFRLFFMIYLFVIVYTLACSRPPMSAEDIVARSVEMHGGDALTNWDTMVIQGEVYQEDRGVNFWYRGEYLLYAQKPDKLRIEKDLTKYKHARLFFSYIYNNGTGWMLRSLIPNYGEQYARPFKRILDMCDGIAYYANSAEMLILNPEISLDGRPVYSVTAVIDGDTTNLCIDKKTFNLVQEEYDNVKRMHSNFKKFGDVVHATTVDEITSGMQTDEVNFTYNTIEYNVPIDQSLFEEDMPKSRLSR